MDRRGLRAHALQVGVLVFLTVLVGGMVGQERTVVPLLAERVFGVEGFTAVLVFIGAFGSAKAFTNLAAGFLADRVGRKPVLVAGWLVGLPVPLLLIWAPSWEWVVGANVLLGVNQGLTWSVAVIMKIDLAEPHQRGLAAGLNETAGYLGVALAAWATGYLAAAFGLRPAPFLLGTAFAVVGTAVSWMLVAETRPSGRTSGTVAPVAFGEAFARTTFREPSLSAAAQAGFVNNLNDAAAWGLFPILFAGAGLSRATIGLLVALYPAVWGLGQLGTGPLSDRMGRKPLIAAGMFLQAAGLAAVAGGRTASAWAAGSLVLGIGTALAYPTLLAAVGDAAGAGWRASALGTYRLWRDLGFAAGALVLGWAADASGPAVAVWGASALTALSGLAVVVRMGEPVAGRMAPAWREE